MEPTRAVSVCVVLPREAPGLEDSKRLFTSVAHGRVTTFTTSKLDGATSVRQLDAEHAPHKLMDLRAWAFAWLAQLVLVLLPLVLVVLIVRACVVVRRRLWAVFAPFSPSSPRGRPLPSGARGDPLFTGAREVTQDGVEPPTSGSFVRAVLGGGGSRSRAVRGAGTSRTAIA